MMDLKFEHPKGDILFKSMTNLTSRVGLGLPPVPCILWSRLELVPQRRGGTEITAFLSLLGPDEETTISLMLSIRRLADGWGGTLGMRGAEKPLEKARLARADYDLGIKSCEYGVLANGTATWAWHGDAPEAARRLQFGSLTVFTEQEGLHSVIIAWASMPTEHYHCVGLPAKRLDDI